MASKVKIQDIADRAGLSRNTVSKIFNGKYNGPEKTRDYVLQIAVDMEYKEYGLIKKVKDEKSPFTNTKNILILTKGDIINSNFFSYIVNEIQNRIEGEGYTLLLSNIREVDIEVMQLPANLENGIVDGIVCMELFDKKYIEKLLSIGIPTVFVEFYYEAWVIQGNYDIIMMNNEFQICQMVNSLIKSGFRKIGFVGDYRHCRGFYERYMGYTNALKEHNIPIDPKLCMVEEDGDVYFDLDLICSKIKMMDPVPDVFVCVNDAIAINIIKSLKRLGYSVPGEVQIISFDDIAEAAAMNPTLTTIRIFKEELGRSAIDILLDRMEYPNKKRRIVYVDTERIIRESTNRNINWL